MPAHPFIPFVDCAVVNWHFLLQGIPCESTWGFHANSSADFTVTNLGTLLDNLIGWLDGSLLPLQTSIVLSTDLIGIMLDSATGGTATRAHLNSGHASGSPVPNQVMNTVTFLTGIRGRNFRGRNFVAGLPDSGLADQKNWSDTTVGLLTTAYRAMETAASAANWAPAVLSRRTAGAPRIDGLATLITDYRSNVPVKTLRGRLT